MSFKKIIAAAISATMAISAFTGIVHADGNASKIEMTIGSPVMLVNGEQISIDDDGTAPVIISDRTLLPVRAVVENMGGEVMWDDETRTASLVMGSDEIRLIIDSHTAYFNNEPQTLDVTPVIINDRTFLPIRFIAESFGYTVGWEQTSQKVSIISKTATAMIGSDPNQTTTVKNVPMMRLSNGLSIPQLGIGTFSLSDGVEAYNSVLSALQNGYRHIDTAHAYENEKSVGLAIRDSSVPREEIWVTSKVWPSEYGEEETKAAIDKMLDRLGIEYLDLVYLHQPIGDVKGAWKALEQCVKDGKIRSLGLSNFDYDESLFDELIASAEIKPVIMQLECHPYAQRKFWQDKIRENDMVFESWYPLGGRTSEGISLRDNSEIAKIAAAHNKSAVQVIIRWHIQEGFSVVPGSSNPDHIAENIDVFDFELTDEEMETIRSLDKEERFFNLPYEQLEQFITNWVVDDYTKGVTVRKDAQSITGYTVDFVYEDADADSVDLYGSFAFFSHDSYPDSFTPYEYKDGMFTVNFGIETNGNDTIPMTKIEGTNLWTVSVPMPEGQYNYLFNVTKNGELTQVADPTNMPEISPITGHTASRSRFYVGEGYDSDDALTAIMPHKGDNGTIEYKEYTDVNGNKQGLAVYLPYGYDADRQEPYKTIYLSHGGGGTEMSWLFPISAPNVMDNLIADGTIEPAIIVAMDNSGYNWDFEVIANNLEKSLIPYIEEAYNVSKNNTDRAFTGVSMGGITASTIMAYHTDLFGYYGVWSGSNAAVIKNGNDIYKKADMKAIKDSGVKIHLAQGYLDIANKRINQSYATETDISLDGFDDYLTESGIEHQYHEIDGGHDQPTGGKMFVSFVTDFLWK